MDIVHSEVEEIDDLLGQEQQDLDLNDNITVLLFLGNNPMDHATAALNVKEMVYDKFKGFKRFQVLVLVTEGSEEQVKDLRAQLYQYSTLDYWHFITASEEDIRDLYNSLLTKKGLEADLFTNEIFIVDKELNQRGRKDDRNKAELKRNDPVYALYGYDAIQVSELKNKMSEDMRILFTEYRQKRKGNYSSTTRRADDLNADEKN